MDALAEGDPIDQITLQQTDALGRYAYKQGDGPEAEMTLVKSEGLWIIDHTAVPEAYRGQGVGKRLVTRAVEDARAAGIRILPLCPFAKAQFERHPEWSDVLVHS